MWQVSLVKQGTLTRPEHLVPPPLHKGAFTIHRAPYEFRTRRLAVEFRDRAGPYRISFLRRSWSHIQRSPDDAR